MDMIQIQDNPSPQFNPGAYVEPPQIEKPPLELTNSYLQKKSPFSKKSKAPANIKCPSHPEETLQFYCFDNKSLLCTECLARGGYSGLDVMNIKRAAERVKEKLRGGMQTDGVKVEDFYLVEKEMEGHEAQIEKTIFNYKREVKEKMDILRSAIDKKEQEALEKINRVHEGKLKAIKDVLSSFKVLKGEIESDSGQKDQNLGNLTDIDVCQYYSTKIDAFDNKSSSSEDIAAKIEKAKRLIEVQQSRDQICFTKFDEEFRRVQSYIENFSVDIGTKNSVSISPTAITESISSSKFNFSNRLSAYSILEERKHRRKEQEDSSAKLKAPSPRPTSAQKNNSFLTKAGSNDETSTPRTPAKQSTPRSTFLAEKSSAGLKRDSSQKSFSAKSNAPFTAFPTNYKDWLTQQVKAKIESTTPKGSARDEMPAHSINSFRSGAASNKGLVDSFYLSKTLIKPETAAAKTMLETSIVDQMSLYRTAPDLQASHREQMSLTSKLANKNEGLGSFEFDNPFASKKGQNQVESILSSESRLKEKLRKLNSQIFK